MFPYEGLAEAIRARRHTPVVATSPSYRSTVEHAGIEFAAVGPEIDPTDRAKRGLVKLNCELPSRAPCGPETDSSPCSPEKFDIRGIADDATATTPGATSISSSRRA